jgi:CHAD domain-containing protein
MTTHRGPDTTAAVTTALLRKRAAEYARPFPKAFVGDEEAVHDLRVAARRLRVALPLLASQVDDARISSLGTAVRDVGRAAAESRDLDVIFGLLGPGFGEAPSEESRILARRLAAARRRSRRRLAEAMMDLDIAGLRRDLRTVAARGGEPLFVVLSRLRQRREALGERIQERLVALGGRFVAERLHDIRILCRRLRYVAELHAELKGVDTGGAAILKSVQDPLGSIQDGHVVAVWLREQAASSDRRGQGRVAAEARRLATAWRRAGRGYHRVFLELNPALLVRRALAAPAAAGAGPRPLKVVEKRDDRMTNTRSSPGTPQRVRRPAGRGVSAAPPTR